MGIRETLTTVTVPSQAFSRKFGRVVGWFRQSEVHHGPAHSLEANGDVAKTSVPDDVGWERHFLGKVGRQRVAVALQDLSSVFVTIDDQRHEKSSQLGW